MFNPRPKQKITFKGIAQWFAKPIQFEVRVPLANWSQFFGKYENQKWGTFDTDSCWALSTINCLEDQCEWLRDNNLFPKEALIFFNQNGYIDIDGDFNLSERYLEIQGKQGTAGGTAPLAWQLIYSWGCIPRPMLTFDGSDYFSPSAVTPQMIALGKQFKQYVNTAYQNIGTNKDDMKEALQMAPLNIGIPVPINVFNWNNSVVTWDGNYILAHEVELYGIDDKGQYLIFDQYEPHLKVLSADYYIGKCTQGIAYSGITSPIYQPSTNSFWTKFFNTLNNALSSFKFA